jgi:putative ABC transport system permease protein
MDRAQYKEHFHDELVDLYHVYVRSPETDSPETVSEGIRRRWGLQESLFVQTRDELRSYVRQMVRRLYAVGYAQELVVMLVAALGVVTALLISILQRRRELGLLRAVGASRFQVLRSVLAEAVLMGIIGSALGLAFGIPLEWYAMQVVFLDEAGFTFPLRIPWQQIGGVIGLALLLALTAGLIPAVHAVRLRIADAIAHE